MMEDKAFAFIAKCIAFIAGIIATLVIGLRGIAGFLLASRSDFGVAGAFFVIFLTILLVVYLVLKFIKFVRNNV